MCALATAETHLAAGAAVRPLEEVAAAGQIKRFGRFEEFLAAKHRRFVTHTHTRTQTHTHRRRDNGLADIRARLIG